ncbi:MAG: Type II secretion system protein E [Parcubacteria group bacterium GW2011_GWA2_39_18]|nr:MAG: Type II secretion system protein E [Parcubacteria group bacterium GW2011_GWA2_39_18]
MIQAVEDSQLAAFLEDSGLISKGDLKSALEEAEKNKTPLEQVLIKSGKISNENLAKLKAYILGIPFVDLTKENIPKNILHTMPEPVARQHNIIAFKKNGGSLEVAMLDLNDLQTIDFLRKKTGLKILPRLTNQESIKHALSQYQKSLSAEFEGILQKDSEKITLVEETNTDKNAGAETLQKMASELPIIRIVDTLTKHAILQDASDIHIEPMEQEVLVRYRVDGILHDAMTLPAQIQTGLAARIKVMANLKLDEHRLPQDGRFKISTSEYNFSIRVSILPVYYGEKIVMRLLPEDTKGLTLTELGFDGESLETLQKNIRKPVGMILATGPTGSGKTTTLYTILEMINTPKVNISTIEDPIEYQIPRVNQTQVKPEIGLSFANGLRSLLRQDPNVIMVGEIRDNETASLAINAALTGHQVLSTLHTNSAAGTMPRLIDMKIEPFLLSSTLNIIIAQRLVRRLGPAKEKYKLSAEEIQRMSKEINLKKVVEVLIKEKVVAPNAKIEDIVFYHPEASEEAPDGYKGRIGIHEVLEVTPAIKELISKSASSDEIELEAKKEGMITMLEDGFKKSAQGITSLEEVFRVTKE